MLSQTSSMSSPAIDVNTKLFFEGNVGHPYPSSDGKMKLGRQLASLMYTEINYKSAAVNLPGVKSVKKTLNANLRSLLGI